MAQKVCLMCRPMDLLSKEPAEMLTCLGAKNCSIPETVAMEERTLRNQDSFALGGCFVPIDSDHPYKRINQYCIYSGPA